MHASIHQLLSIRDGEPVDAEITQHVHSCASCSAEFDRLQRVREGMRSLDMPEPPLVAWEQVRNRMSVRESTRPRWIAFASAAALASIAIASGLWLRYSGSGSISGTTMATNQPAQVKPAIPLEHLVAQSRELDRDKRKKIVWDIERILVEDAARPVVLHGSAGNCWQPYVRNYKPHDNSQYNTSRFEDVWLDK